tara:strand:- start:46 stop:273 length:228 start_codon:yes stop_codon:yes gene_type:complete
LITLEAELTKKEYGLLRASILVHIEIATISGKNGRTKLQDKLGTQLLNLCDKLNIEHDYDKDFFKEKKISLKLIK